MAAVRCIESTNGDYDVVDVACRVAWVGSGYMVDDGRFPLRGGEVFLAAAPYEAVAATRSSGTESSRRAAASSGWSGATAGQRTSTFIHRCV